MTLLHILLWFCAAIGAAVLALLAWAAFMDVVDPLFPTGLRPRRRRDD